MASRLKAPRGSRGLSLGTVLLCMVALILILLTAGTVAA